MAPAPRRITEGLRNVVNVPSSGYFFVPYVPLTRTPMCFADEQRIKKVKEENKAFKLDWKAMGF